MRSKTLRLLLIICVLAALLALMIAGAAIAVTKADGGGAKSADVAQAVRSLGMFSDSKWTVHYRAPSEEQIELLLRDEGIPLDNPDMRAAAIDVFQQEWAERNPTTPNPKKLQKLLEGEYTHHVAKWTGPQIMSLAVPVEFPNTETFDWYGTTGHRRRSTPQPDSGTRPA